MWTGPRRSTSTSWSSCPITTDQVNDDLRFVELTHPARPARSASGPASPACARSVEGMQVVVADVAAARTQLADKGVEVSAVDVQPWGSFVYFGDPDGTGGPCRSCRRARRGRTVPGGDRRPGSMTRSSRAALSPGGRRTRRRRGRHRRRTPGRGVAGPRPRRRGGGGPATGGGWPRPRGDGRRRRAIVHVAARNPSTSTPAWTPGRSYSAATAGSATIRLRSAWDRSTLSYSGRNRGGAGVVGVGQGRVGHVEQLPAPLVAERPQLRAEPVDDFAARRSGGSTCAMSTTDGRAVGGQVAQHHGVGRWDRRREAGRGTRRPSPTAPARWVPEAAGRHLHQGQEVADAVGEVAGVVVGPLGPEGPTEVGQRAGPVGDERPAPPPPALAVDAASPRPNGEPWYSSRDEHGLHHRPQAHAVAAVTRWMVPRSSGSRTARRVSTSASRSAGSKPAHP